jgi:hypothetical protein
MRVATLHHKTVNDALGPLSIPLNRSFLTLSFGLLVAPVNHRSICARVTVWRVIGSRTATSIFVPAPIRLLKPLLLAEDLEPEDRRLKQASRQRLPPSGRSLWNPGG